MFENEYLESKFKDVPWRLKFTSPHLYAIVEDLSDNQLMMSPLLSIGLHNLIYPEPGHEYRVVGKILGFDRTNGIFAQIPMIRNSQNSYLESANSSFIEYMRSCLSLQYVLTSHYGLLPEQLMSIISHEAVEHFIEFYYMLAASFLQSGVALHELYLAVSLFSRHICDVFNMNDDVLIMAKKEGISLLMSNLSAMPDFKTSNQPLEEPDNFDAELWNTFFEDTI